MELAGEVGAGAFVFGVIFCQAGNLIWATVSGGRELGLREAYEVAAKCILPPFAQDLLHRYLLQHPEWDLMVMDESIYPRYTRDYQLMIR